MELSGSADRAPVDGLADGIEIKLLEFHGEGIRINARTRIRD